MPTKTNKSNGNYVPTLEEYIADKINAKRAAALDKSRNRTSIRVPMIENTKSKEDWENSILNRYNAIQEDLNLYLSDPKHIYSNTIKNRKEMLKSLEDEYRLGYPKLVPGANCMYNAGDCYGLDIASNVEFATKAKQLGFKKGEKGSMEPGDIVQDVKVQRPVHAMIYDSKDKEGNLLFNYARGYDDNDAFDINKNYVKQGKYRIPIEDFDVYKYVGTPADSTQWINEYKQKYGNGMRCGGRRKARLGLDIREGGIAQPIAPNTYYMIGRSHDEGGIGIGPNNKNGLEVEGGEVVKVGNKDIKVFSSVPFLRGVSPAQLVMGGVNPNKVFKAQEDFKDRNRINDDGTTYENGGDKIYTPSKSIQHQIQETGKVTIGGAPTISGLRTYGYIKSLANARKYGNMATNIFRAGKEFIKRGTEKLVESGKISRNVAQIPRSIYSQFVGVNGQNLPKTVNLFTDNEMRLGGRQKAELGIYQPKRNEKGQIVINPNNPQDVKWFHEQQGKRGARAVNKAKREAVPLIGTVLGLPLAGTLGTTIGLRGISAIGDVSSIIMNPSDPLNYIGMPWTKMAKQADKILNVSKAIDSAVDNSKIVNIPVYHGSNKVFDDFNYASSQNIGVHAGTRKAANDRLNAIGAKEDANIREGILTMNENNIIPIKDIQNFDVYNISQLYDNNMLFKQALKKAGIKDNIFKQYITPMADDYQTLLDNKKLVNDLAERGIMFKYINKGEDVGSTSYMITNPNRVVWSKNRIKKFGGSMIYTINGNIKNGLERIRPKAEWGKGKDEKTWKYLDDPENFVRGYKQITPYGKIYSDRDSYIIANGKKIWNTFSNFMDEAIKYQVNKRPQYYAKKELPLFGNQSIAEKAGLARSGWSYADIPTFDYVPNINISAPTNYVKAVGDNAKKSTNSTLRRGESKSTVSVKSKTEPAYINYKPNKVNLAVEADNPTSKTLTKIDTSSTGGGTQSKDGRWVGQYKTTNLGDWIGLGSNLAGSVASYFMTKSAIDKMPEPLKPVMAPAVKLKTKYNIEPQLTNINEAEQINRASVRQNTQSSNTSLAREQRLMNEARGARNTLYGQKENIETQLINQDRLNRQSVMKDNVKTYNEYLNKLIGTKTVQSQLKVSNINNLISGLTGSVNNILGNIESRRATNNTLRAIAAANPNVDARLIGGFDYYIDPITKKKYNKNQQYVGTING